MNKPKVRLYHGEGSAVIIDGLDNYDTKEAVEKMIDALCIAYKSIENLEDSNNLYIPAKTNIKDALKKAGVEL